MSNFISLGKVCKDFGGVSEILILPFSYVSNSNKPRKQYCSVYYPHDIEITEYPVQYRFKRNSVKFTEKQVIGNKAGDYFEQTLTFELKKDRVEVAENIQSHANNRCMMIFKDCNENQRILFNVRVKADSNSRQKKSEGSANFFVITSKRQFKAPFWTGNLII